MSYINTIQKKQTFEYNQPNKPKRQQLNNSSLSYNSVNPNNVMTGESLPKRKAFTSRYVNDSGKWTQNAVNDGFVKFDDYINDIKNTTEKYPSFNGKEFKTNSNGMPVLKNQFMMDDTYYDGVETEDFDSGLLVHIDIDKGQEIRNYLKRTADKAMRSAIGDNFPAVASMIQMVKKSTDPSFHKEVWKWGGRKLFEKT